MDNYSTATDIIVAFVIKVLGLEAQGLFDKVDISTLYKNTYHRTVKKVCPELESAILSEVYTWAQARGYDVPKFDLESYRDPEIALDPEEWTEWANYDQ